MKKIIEIFKGMMIGIANVIPGLSGGTIAVAFNVYDKFIYGFSGFFKSPLKTIKDLWAIVIGMGLGVAVSVVGVIYFLDNFPVPTTLLFVGMIFGSLPLIRKKISKEEKSKGDVISFISTCLLLLGILVLHIFFGENMANVSTLNFGLILIIFFLGIASAATMIVPGISGSMILMVLGYYYYVTSLSEGIIKSVLDFDFTNIWSFVLPMIPFLIGNIVGIVFMSKILEKILIKFPRALYSGILGLLIVSPILIFYSMYKDYKDSVISSLTGVGAILTITISLVLCVSGALFVNYMSKFEGEPEKTPEEEPKGELDESKENS